MGRSPHVAEAYTAFSAEGLKPDLAILFQVYWGGQYTLGKRTGRDEEAQDAAVMTWM